AYAFPINCSALVLWPMKPVLCSIPYIDQTLESTATPRRTAALGWILVHLASPGNSRLLRENASTASYGQYSWTTRLYHDTFKCHTATRIVVGSISSYPPPELPLAVHPALQVPPILILTQPSPSTLFLLASEYVRSSGLSLLNQSLASKRSGRTMKVGILIARVRSHRQLTLRMKANVVDVDVAALTVLQREGRYGTDVEAEPGRRITHSPPEPMRTGKCGTALNDGQRWYMGRRRSRRRPSTGTFEEKLILVIVFGRERLGEGSDQMVRGIEVNVHFTLMVSLCWMRITVDTSDSEGQRKIDVRCVCVALRLTTNNRVSGLSPSPGPAVLFRLWIAGVVPILANWPV
ncbi:hypothetical protein BV25DRAFT_1843580, partial [Artomyces pyxidatus]